MELIKETPAISDLDMKDEATWKMLSDEWACSGESQPAFCKRKGITYSTFVSWRSRILKSSGKSRIQFKAVNVVGSRKSNPSASSIHLLLPSGIEVDITSGVDVSTLQSVFRCLGVSR